MTNIISRNQRMTTHGSVWPAQKSAWATSFEIFCKSVFKIYCPLQTFGRENLPSVPFIICSNHASHLDSSMLMAATGLAFQKIGLIAAKDYFFDQSHRFYLHYMMNLVPIARGNGGRAIKDSIIACRSFLDEGGQALIIYPEGTRTITGVMGRFKEGAAILAHELDLPMVPAYVGGSFNALPKGSYFIKPHRLWVAFGEPVMVSDWLSYDEKNDRRATFIAYREATAEIQKRVRDLEDKNAHD
ncbi:MAG: 1-acyl-sn-glycerol-3-phosphate acyltransferase [Myxococcales bacterium]|nr:1-acyl-sn-glycerol-3-phosphate acyltransferase [Myxococcales bacterium]USN51756.1 MAG: 1-acyl-sn-glycerol-3-phosphate acyltransferase [Myxococcales bacterium]